VSLRKKPEGKKYLDLRWQFRVYIMRNSLPIYQILLVINSGREEWLIRVLYMG
jgi:hypothetical protein